MIEITVSIKITNIQNLQDLFAFLKETLHNKRQGGKIHQRGLDLSQSHLIGLVQIES